MSRAAKITLAVSVVGCVGTIWAVHYMQRREREVRILFLFFLFNLMLRRRWRGRELRAGTGNA